MLRKLFPASIMNIIYKKHFSINKEKMKTLIENRTRTWIKTSDKKKHIYLDEKFPHIITNPRIANATSMTVLHEHLAKRKGWAEMEMKWRTSSPMLGWGQTPLMHYWQNWKEGDNLRQLSITYQSLNLIITVNISIPLLEFTLQKYSHWHLKERGPRCSWKHYL